MKKNLLSLILCFLAFSLFGTLKAQTEAIYQLPNSGFEEWYRETSNAGSIVPVNFNSFYSAQSDCLLCSMGVAKRCDSSRDVRNDAAGTFSLYLFSTSTLGIRANGNVTTGRMWMGSTSALNVNNYNYTDFTLNAPKHYQEFRGTPDSLRFWVKYLPGRNGETNTVDYGRIRAYIHGTGECRDAPVFPSGKVEEDYYYGKAVKQFYKEDGGWHCYTVPFEYTGNNTQKNADGNYYLLLSMTTNMPGGGANNADQVWFDDVEFVYGAYLADLRVHGVTIPGFEKNLLVYGGPTLEGTPGSYAFPYQPSDITYTVERDSTRSVVITNVNGPDGDADGGYTSILVTAEDYVSTKEYRIYYYADRSDDNTIAELSYTLDEETTIAVPGFTPATTNYSVSFSNPEETRIPQITTENITLSHAAATIYDINPLTSMPTGGMAAVASITVRAENYNLKTYTVSFSKVVSTNSKLSMIQIAGVDMEDFDSDTLSYDYHIATCVTNNNNFPAITYEKSSVYSNVLYTPATLTNRTATIVVTAENGDVTTYKVNFILSNDNATLLGYRINTTNRNNSFTAANNYTDTYSASFTAPFTLSLSSTAAQLPCAGATVQFPSQVVWFPDTNKIVVTAQDLVTKLEYGVVVKNTNSYLLQTSGQNVGLKYIYDGVVRNITVPNTTNANDQTINVTIPVAGPNEPCVLVEAAPRAPVVDTIIYTQPTSRAGNSGKVTIIANDGVSSKTYIINFTPTISNDATLSTLTYDGFNVPGFTAGSTTELYTIIVPSSVTELPEIAFTPSFQWLPEENIVYTPALTFADTTIIEVTAENGAMRTFKIAYEVVPQEKDAYLIDIRYNDVTIKDFNSTRYTYIEEVPYSAPVPPVIVPFASSPTAVVLPTTQLTTPPYTQGYLVFSEDMSVHKYYTVDFLRVKNTNALLADIIINDESILDFNPEQFEYEHEFLYTVLDAPVVTAIPAFEHASVEIEQINTVNGTVTITVTAEDEAFSEVYTIEFTRELSPVTNIHSIVYEYDSDINTYAVTGNDNEIIIMLPVETLDEPVITDILLTDFRAQFEIEEQPDETNDFTGTVIVTAEDETEETYAIIFQKTLSSSTLITGISYNGTPVPDFDPDVTTYDIILPFNTSSVQTVAATAAWVNTEITITQAPNPFGNATVLVTSEDGANIKIYTIVFQRQGDPYLVTLSYNLDGTVIPVPGFHPQTYVYNIELPLATTAVPVLEYVEEDNRCEITVDQQNEPDGTSSITLVTWNEDATVTYTVNFTVPLSTEALLSDLQVDGVTINNFNPNTFTYVVPPFEYGTVAFPVVTATATQPDATIEPIEQIDEYPGVVTVKVYAGDVSVSNTYTISFSVEPGDNNYLDSLFIDGKPLMGFNKNIYFYNSLLNYGTTELPVVTAIAEDERADISILPDTPQIGDTVKIIVTAINGEERVYQVLFTVDGNNNAYLDMIYIDWKPLENFEGYLPDYTINLPATYVGFPDVSAVLADSAANIVYSGKVSGTYPPQYQIKVLAENGRDSFTYTLTFLPTNSIINFDNEAQIQVYPNPATHVIHFEIDEQILTGNLEIYSIEGKRIGIHNLQGGINTVHVGHLQNGFYFYKIFVDGVVLGTGKFVKN